MATTIDTCQLITDRIISMLEAGVAPWRKTWSTTGNSSPVNGVSGNAYKGINRILLASSPYECPAWVTYKQAQDMGGHVRKGEKATPVIFYKMWEKEDGDGIHAVFRH